jgi:hypothetical protein|tara:strand:- start:4805 stop:5221 length:417 start_codon:yes stop_codon:yes gene_type:complete
MAVDEKKKDVIQADEKNRPSIGDYFGRPSTNNNHTNLATALITITDDKKDWLVSSIFNEKELAVAKRLLARKAAKNGRVDYEEMVFQTGQLNRALNGRGLEQYIGVATGEQRQMQALQNWFNRIDATAPAQQPQGPSK